MANIEKSRYWSITINNPTDADEREIAMARQKGWILDGQKEVGEEGTPHYQLILDCKAQQRFSAVKKALSRAHIEKAKSVDALRTYVHKEETRVGELKVGTAQYPSQEEVWTHWASFVRHLQNKHGERYLRERVWKNGILPLWDEYINEMIMSGYFVELIGINPQIRSAVKTYGKSILTRCGVHIWTPGERLWDPKTDRQTDSDITLAADNELKINVPIEHNQDADEEEILPQASQDLSPSDEEN